MLFECLDYDPVSGVFTWKQDRPISHFKTVGAYRTWKSRFSGKVAGCQNQAGLNTKYVLIRVFGKPYLAHRLAWLFSYGVWPEFHIDHIDGDGQNNSINNLRDVPPDVNGKNARRKKNNTSGVNGVYLHKQTGKWCAEGHYTECGIKKKKYLGLFPCIKSAEAARLAWEEEQGGFSDKHGT